MRYSALTPETRRQMLETIGVNGVEDLLASIPADHRSDGTPDIAGPIPEMSLLRRLDSMRAPRPRFALTGAGIYPHYIPPTVDSLCARSEWVTSYTPYQPELAQGTLAMYYEFQTYMAMLTGCEIANAGMYDGATALAEAVLMARRLRPKARPVVYVSRTVHPQYVAVLKTYMRFVELEVVPLPYDPRSGRTRVDVDENDRQDAVAVVFQSPNYFGVIDDIDDFGAGPIKIAACTEPMSLALVEPARCDIATGECQSFGIPMQFGGPTAGFFATRAEWVRKTPGRLVGRTVDAAGEEAFCITLATREQFIRREKATSNICTSSGLMCLRSTVYLSLMGRKGLTEVAEKNARCAHFLARELDRLGLPTRFAGPFFNEFVVDCSADPGLFDRLGEHDIVLGMPLAADYPELANHYVICATEVHYPDAPTIVEEIASLVRLS